MPKTEESVEDFKRLADPILSLPDGSLRYRLIQAIRNAETKADASAAVKAIVLNVRPGEFAVNSHITEAAASLWVLKRKLGYKAFGEIIQANSEDDGNVSKEPLKPLSSKENNNGNGKDRCLTCGTPIERSTPCPLCGRPTTLED